MNTWTQRWSVVAPWHKAAVSLTVVKPCCPFTYWAFKQLNEGSQHNTRVKSLVPLRSEQRQVSGSTARPLGSRRPSQRLQTGKSCSRSALTPSRPSGHESKAPVIGTWDEPGTQHGAEGRGTSPRIQGTFKSTRTKRCKRTTIGDVLLTNTHTLYFTVVWIDLWRMQLFIYVYIHIEFVSFILFVLFSNS